MANKKRQPHKWKIKDEQLELVGMQYRITPSTRRFVQQWIRDHGSLLVEFKREPKNVHDANAIAVYASEDNPYRGLKLGYVRRQVAEILAPAIDAGSMELGTSVLTSVDEDAGTGILDVKMRIRRK